MHYSDLVEVCTKFLENCYDKLYPNSQSACIIDVNVVEWLRYFTKYSPSLLEILVEMEHVDQRWDSEVKYLQNI